MMTQQLQADVVTAPIAAIDRRALSQAWYSALHLARHTDGSAPAPPRPQKATAMPNARAKMHAAKTGAPLRAPSAPRAGSAQRRTAAEAFVDRRAPRSPLAREIERVFLNPRVRVERSTFVLADDGARVHVVLQDRGDRLHLVAICAPANKRVVMRALAQARFALASRGIALDVEAPKETACS